MQMTKMAGNDINIVLKNRKLKQVRYFLIPKK